MATFMSLVSEHMISPVRTVGEQEWIADAERTLSALGISALPAVNGTGSLTGVLSRTDLLRVGRMRATNGKRHRVLALPESRVKDVMHGSVEIVARDTPLAEAARRMCRDRIHRLYVAEDRRAVGVVSTKEVMRAVIDARIKTPLREIMDEGVVSVRSEDSLALATDRLGAAHHHGLLVVEEGWPVGVFTQEDALASRDASPQARVDEWMDARVICLPLAAPACRAAEQAIATRARAVLAVDGNAVRGILSAMAFVRLAMGHAHKVDGPGAVHR